MIPRSGWVQEPPIPLSLGEGPCVGGRVVLGVWPESKGCDLSLETAHQDNLSAFKPLQKHKGPSAL